MNKTPTPVLAVAFIHVLIFGSMSYARMSPRQIYQSYSPGVVLIVASPQGSASASAGTGSIIRSDGTIVTSYHVVHNKGSNAPFQEILVFLKPNKVTGNMNKDLRQPYKAKLRAFDKALDLAILKMINPPSKLTVLTLGDPNQVGPGDQTIAIGHPEQGGLWTITSGVIGAEFEDFRGIPGKHVFQMEASLNRGNSGGPLFDVRGYQVGMNTAIARKGKDGVAITGVNFAIKSSVVKQWASKHKVMLGYGNQHFDQEENSTMMLAKKPPKKRPVSLPAPRKEGETVYRDPESGGIIRLEEGTGEKDPEEEPVESQELGSTEAKRSFVSQPGERKPLRFKQHFRIQPRPYSFKRLFTAVDRVKNRAQDAFDDLERESRRRRR